MAVKYFVDDKFIPDDGTTDIIERFSMNTDCDIFVYPDVHLKKNTRMANGILISSGNQIYLSCLGVENCGFTFGKIRNSSHSELIHSFKKFSNILSDRKNIPVYKKDYVQERFDMLLSSDYKQKRFLYDFLGFDSCIQMLSEAHRVLDGRIIQLACDTLCTLGGGNHFFEIHEIVENNSEDFNIQKGMFLFMLHSDSIAVGDLVFNLYSDLWEMFMNSPQKIQHRLKVEMFRQRQKKYFKGLGLAYDKYKDELDKIFIHTDDFQYVAADSVIGKNLLFAHHICSLFGDMNRYEIIDLWSRTQGIQIQLLGNHSHDSVSVELHNGHRKIVHRNGVQYIGDDKYCILPGAMGTYSYVLENAYNNEAYFSMNHGVGRMQDKHIAKCRYTEKQTMEELKERRILLFQAGGGNLAEQNMHAFKDPTEILEQMEKYKLAKAVAKLCPIAIIKG